MEWGVDQVDMACFTFISSVAEFLTFPSRRIICCCETPFNTLSRYFRLTNEITDELNYVENKAENLKLYFIGIISKRLFLL